MTQKTPKVLISTIIVFIILLSTCLLLGCSHEHSWTSASCYSPKTCVKCGETEGDIRGHRWIDATCEKAKYCKDCGLTAGYPLNHTWVGGSYNSPQICKNCDKMKPLDTPKNGQVFIGKTLYCNSQITITTNSKESCYIKLKGSSGVDVFSFFVRAGSTVTVSVPSGYYYVYFAHGIDWYGTEYLFGSSTTYSKDDELLDFNNYSWKYTLYETTNGNFTETPISEDEFK